MRDAIGFAGLVVTLLGVAACGGPAPTQGPFPTEPSPHAITIDVLGMDGAQSFRPNPATIPPGETVVWYNADSVTHRVVFDDSGVATGNIEPGAFSAPMVLTVKGPYHCSIHPTMTGTVLDR